MGGNTYGNAENYARWFELRDRIIALEEEQEAHTLTIEALETTISKQTAELKRVEDYIRSLHTNPTEDPDNG